MSLLTLAQLKARVTTSLDDATLQDLIDAAEAEIARWAGSYALTNDGLPVIGVTETIRTPGALSIRLLASVDTITTVTEDDELLELDTDYLVEGDTLTRLDSSGTPDTWGDVVAVEYHPLDATAVRRVATASLVELHLNQHPGITSMTIGQWAEAYASDAAGYDEARYAILSQVREPSAIN